MRLIESDQLLVYTFVTLRKGGGAVKVARAPPGTGERHAVAMGNEQDG